MGLATTKDLSKEKPSARSSSWRRPCSRAAALPWPLGAHAAVGGGGAGGRASGSVPTRCREGRVRRAVVCAVQAATVAAVLGSSAGGLACRFATRSRQLNSAADAVLPESGFEQGLTKGSTFDPPRPTRINKKPHRDVAHPAGARRFRRLPERGRRHERQPNRRTAAVAHEPHHPRPKHKPWARPPATAAPGPSWISRSTPSPTTSWSRTSLRSSRRRKRRSNSC